MSKFCYGAEKSADIDVRLSKVREEYGYEGLGIYWQFMCMLAGAGEYDVGDLQYISEMMNCNDEILRFVVLKCNLFEVDGGTIRAKEQAVEETPEETIKPTPKRSRADYMREYRAKKKSAPSVQTELPLEVEKPPEKPPEEKPQKRFVPPSVEEVREYCRKNGKNVDAEAFVAFYESKGWMVGKNKMKSWQSATTTWDKSQCRSPNPPPPRPQQMNLFNKDFSKNDGF